MTLYESSLVRQAINNFYTDHHLAVQTVLIAELQKQVKSLKNPPVNYFETVVAIVPSLFGIAGATSTYVGSKVKSLVYSIAKESTKIGGELHKTLRSGSAQDVAKKLAKASEKSATAIRKKQDTEAKAFWDVLRREEAAFAKKNPRKRGTNSADYLISLHNHMVPRLQELKYFTYSQLDATGINISGDWRWDERMRIFVTLSQLFKKRFIFRKNAGNAHYDGWISLLRMNRTKWKQGIQKEIQTRIKDAKARVERARRFETAQRIVDGIFGASGI